MSGRESLLPLTDSGDDEWFAYLAEQTRVLWKTHGYRVHVQTNQRRVVVTKMIADNLACEVCGESSEGEAHPWCVEAERDQQLREDHLDRF